MSRLISFAVLIAIIIVIGLLFYKVLVGFFVPVFLAAVLVVVFRPLHRWVLDKTGHRDWLAAGVTTLLIVLCLVLPIGVVGGSAAVQGLRLVKDNDASIVVLRMKTIVNSLGLQMPAYDETLRLVSAEIALIVAKTDDEFAVEGNPPLERMGTRLVRLLEQLHATVKAQPDAKKTWDDEFASIIATAELVGKPSPSSVPIVLPSVSPNEDAEEAETETGAETETEDETEAEAKPAEVEIIPSRVAVDLKSKFGRLKTGLLGGPVKSLAREYANPTTADVETMTNNVLGYVQPRLLSITGATGAFVVKMIFASIILVVATFFFLHDGPSMIKTIMYLSPLDDAYEQELLLEFDRISRAVVLATVLSAIVQGMTAGIGYYFAGVDYLFLLIMLTTVFAMVPFVGPAVIWIPVCLYLGLYEDRMLAACVLAVWGVAIVGTIDNVVKALVLHGQSQLHPLLALLSVLGGVQTLGPVGIVVGPMVVAMLQTLLSILQRELLHFDEHRLVVNTGSGLHARDRTKRRKSKESDPTAAAEKVDGASPPEPASAGDEVEARKNDTSPGPGDK